MENFEAINSHETNQNHIFGLIWLEQPWRREENREKKTKKRKKRRKKKEKSNIRYGIKYILMSKVFGMKFHGDFFFLCVGFWKRSPKP